MRQSNPIGTLFLIIIAILLIVIIVKLIAIIPFLFDFIAGLCV